MPSHHPCAAGPALRRCLPVEHSLRPADRPRLALTWLLVCALTTPAFAQQTHEHARTPAQQPTQSLSGTAPLHHSPLPLQSIQAVPEQDWTAANRAVAEFPRGHADIVSWEALAGMPAASPAASVAPEATAHASPHSAEQHDMQSMHQKMHPASQGAKPPMHSGHHTKHRGDHHPAPQGDRP